MAASPRRASEPARLRSLMRIAAVCLAVGLVLADSSIAVLALPAIHRELEVDLGDLHWVLTSFNLVLAAAAIPAARLARALYPARAFGAGLAVFALASLGCALAPDLEALLVLRGVQALGGAAVVVAALEVLAALAPSRSRAVALWTGAGVVGAAVGPALGGVLTETVSWNAVFAVQVPLALVPLAFTRALPRTPVPRTGPTTVRLAPNVALALVSAALVAALFLVVLLLVEGWRLSPIAAAAVVSVLPLTAIATVPLARRIGGRRERAEAGAVLVAGGLAALGLLPGAAWAWTVAPQILLGAGLALALVALTDTALSSGEPHTAAGAVAIAARHTGVVVGLLLLTPVLIDNLDRQRGTAERAGTARLLDAPISPQTKLELARRLGNRLDESPGRLPDLQSAFHSLDAEPDERPALDGLEHALAEIGDRAATSAFTRAFVVAAAFAVAALLPIGLVTSVRARA